MAEAILNRVEFLKGISEWFAGRESADGSTVCPRHKIEHTGKTVYSASLDLALLKQTGDDVYKERLRRRVLRTLTMLRQDPNTGKAVFFPGSLDHRNAASNLIDSGACCDVLAEVLFDVPELFSEEEAGRVRDAVDEVCGGYLMEAVLVKEVPAQRLWGATGLARASVVLDRPRYGERAREAVRTWIEQSNPDGSIPYMPTPEKHGEHVGLSDITSYYHSRHIGFTAYVYRVLDEGLEPEVSDYVRRALDFLVALFGKDGIKPLCNEAKQWYWESDYEVASHSFDVHALIEGARLFDDPGCRWLARRAYDRLVENIDSKDHGVQSHRGDAINFQCRDFWNGHVAWIARVIDDLPADPEEPPPRGIETFEDAGIVRVERPDYVAVVRGKKQPINISFGGEAGGGSLTYFGRRKDGWKDAVNIPKWTSLAPGNYVVTPVDRPSFKQRVMSFYRDNRHDMRFRLYVANIERKAGNTKLALEYPLRHVVNKLRDDLKGRYASHFDVSPSVSVADDNVLVYSSMLARRDGTVLKGSSLTRRYLFGELELEVEDTLVLDQAVRAILYEKISAAEDFAVDTDVPFKENGSTIVFQPGSFPATIRLSYRL